MRANLARDLRLPALACQAGMSERSLVRRYRAVVGSTPARAVERLRVEAACRRLGDTDRPIKEVAHLCGFGSEETMRRSFLRQLEVTPQACRERFARRRLEPDERVEEPPEAAGEAQRRVGDGEAQAILRPRRRRGRWSTELSAITDRRGHSGRSRRGRRRRSTTVSSLPSCVCCGTMPAGADPDQGRPVAGAPGSAARSRPQYRRLRHRRLSSGPGR